jgi:hypothetical protein
MLCEGAQANYYRDPKRLDNYKAGAIFLPDVNNEAMPPNATAAYATNFATLSKLVRAPLPSPPKLHRGHALRTVCGPCCACLQNRPGDARLWPAPRTHQDVRPVLLLANSNGRVAGNAHSQTMQVSP